MYHFDYVLSELNVINVIWYHISLIAVHIVILKPFIKLKEKNTIATVISESKEENKVNWKLTLTVFCENIGSESFDKEKNLIEKIILSFIEKY